MENDTIAFVLVPVDCSPGSLMRRRFECRDIEERGGHLIIHEGRGPAVAIFAPGAWHSVTTEPLQGGKAETA